MQNSLKPSQQLALAAYIKPQAQTAGALSSGYVDASKYKWLYALFALGTPGSSGTLDGKLQQASDSGGTGLKDISGAAIAQLAAEGIAVVEVDTSKLDINNGFRYVKAVATVATATSPTVCFLFGTNERWEPASGGNDSHVVAAVTVN
jgi:hypothetical protein